MYIAGFSFDKNVRGIGFFPYKTVVGSNGDATLYYYPDHYNSSEIITYGRLNASSFFEKQIYGVGIDLETNLFFIQSSQEIRRYQFTVSNKQSKKWYAWLLESTPGSLIVKDTFSVNFGQKPFSFKVPYGFQPFIEEYKDTCKTVHSTYFQCNIFLLFVIVVLDFESSSNN